MFVGVILLLLIYVLYAHSACDRPDVKRCYRRISNNTSIRYLFDVMDGEKMPVSGKSIFFYVTTCLEFGHIDLTTRLVSLIIKGTSINNVWMATYPHLITTITTTIYVYLPGKPVLLSLQQNYIQIEKFLFCFYLRLVTLHLQILHVYQKWLKQY